MALQETIRVHFRSNALSTYLHHIPGRLRVKHAGFKSEPAAMGEVASCLEAVPGVDKVSLNPVTGSLVVLYDCGELEPEVLEGLLRDKGFNGAENAAEKAKRVPEEVSVACRFLGRKAVGLAVERALKGTGFSFLAALI